MNSISTNRNISKKRHTHKTATVVFLWLSALLFAQLVTGCENGGAQKGNGPTPGTALDPLPLTGESLRQIVISGIGDANQLREATLAGEGTEKVVNIGIDRPATCEDGSVEAVMAVITQKIMPGLFEYPEASRVTITMFGVKQGVKNDDVAAKVSVTRTSAQEIDWSMFGPMTMSSMVTDYYLDPGIMGISSAGEGMTGGMYH